MGCRGGASPCICAGGRGSREVTMSRHWWPPRDPDDGLLTTPRRGVRGAHRAQGTEWPVLAAVVLALLVVSLALVVLLVYLAQARACPPSPSPVPDTGNVGGRR